MLTSIIIFVSGAGCGFISAWFVYRNNKRKIEALKSKCADYMNDASQYFKSKD